jgi:hypothetical protein
MVTQRHYPLVVVKQQAGTIKIARSGRKFYRRILEKWYGVNRLGSMSHLEVELCMAVRGCG